MADHKRHHHIQSYGPGHRRNRGGVYQASQQLTLAAS